MDECIFTWIHCQFILPSISPIAIFGSRSSVFGLRSHLCCQACLATAIAAAGAEVPAANCRGSQNQRLMFPLWVNVRLMHLLVLTHKVFGLWFKKMEQEVFRKQFLKERAYRKPPILERTLVINTLFLQYHLLQQTFSTAESGPS